MQLYEVIELGQNNRTTILANNATEALITVVIKKRYDVRYVNHAQYINSVKRRIKKDNGYLKVYNFSVKIN